MYFAAVNRGKESIALDLKKDDDKAVFEMLIQRADVLVENFRPGTMDRLGYGWASLHARFPNLIYAAVSGFGHSGPHADRPAYDIVVQGISGIISITGHPGGPPTRVGTSIGDIAAGMFAAVAVNAALLHRERSGEATMVDIAMLDCQIAILENAVARYTATGHVPGPTGGRHPSITPFEPFESQDGHVIVAAGNDVLFGRLCAALGRPELCADGRFTTNHERTRHAEELRIEITREIKKHTTATWIALLDRVGVPCGPINNIAQALGHPQLAARNMLVEVPDGDGGTLRLAGNPMKVLGFPDPLQRTSAPALDEDRGRILEDLHRRPTKHMIRRHKAIRPRRGSIT